MKADRRQRQRERNAVAGEQRAADRHRSEPPCTPGSARAFAASTPLHERMRDRAAHERRMQQARAARYRRRSGPRRAAASHPPAAGPIGPSEPKPDHSASSRLPKDTGLIRIRSLRSASNLLDDGRPAGDFLLEIGIRLVGSEAEHRLEARRDEPLLKVRIGSRQPGSPDRSFQAPPSACPPARRDRRMFATRNSAVPLRSRSGCPAWPRGARAHSPQGCGFSRCGGARSPAR